MITLADRWEHGSDFHTPGALPDASETAPHWGAGCLLGSGRDALRVLVRHGRTTRGWRRLWTPSYLCQEVVAAIAAEGIQLAAYPDLPESSLVLPEVASGDVVLVVNTFGLRGRPHVLYPVGFDVIEDHTHDPFSSWAVSSKASFAVASLRKTLPVPEGGVLWSPLEYALPVLPPVTTERCRAADSKRKAMALKMRYLAGEPVEKEAFRKMSLAGEAEIAYGEISGMTTATRVSLAGFPFQQWREVRRRNHAYLAGRLAHLTWLHVLQPETAACVPFSVVVVVDEPERRDRLRARLIERRVYPAVLWPLGETVVPVAEEARAFSRRVLSLHCDFRYDEDDLALVAAFVEAAGRV